MSSWERANDYECERTRERNNKSILSAWAAIVRQPRLCNPIINSYFPSGISREHSSVGERIKFMRFLPWSYMRGETREVNFDSLAIVVTQRQAIKHVKISWLAPSGEFIRYTNSFSPHRDLNYVQTLFLHPYFLKLVRSSGSNKLQWAFSTLHNNLRARDASRSQLLSLFSLWFMAAVA